MAESVPRSCAGGARSANCPRGTRPSSAPAEEALDRACIEHELRRASVTTNSVHTAGYARESDLRVQRYEVIEGAVKWCRRDETQPSM